MGKDNVFTDEHISGAVARQKYQNEMKSYEIDEELCRYLDNNGVRY